MVLLPRLRIILTSRSLHTNRLLLHANGATIPPELNVVKKLKDVVGSQHTQKIPKDRSLIKLGVWIVIFGSMLMHVIDKKQQYEEMEEKYNLKIDILKSIISRINNGETVNIDDELRLVNQTLERRNINRYPSPLQNYKKQKSTSIDGTISENLNFPAYENINNESLEDIWQNVLKDITTSPSQTLSSNDPVTTRFPPNDTHKDHTIPSDDIIRDRNVLLETSKQEQEELKYFTPTNTHIIVDKPGELVEAAKGTQMTRYL